MTTTIVEVRAGCRARRHDTSPAYRKAGCRCPAARHAETARKAKYDRHRDRAERNRAAQLAPHVIAACPPFHTDPRRNCAELADPNIMFPDRAEQVPLALGVCVGCPLKRPCARWALDTRQIYGVYGGVSAVVRRRQISARLKQVAA